jgi:hypothetical protein
MGGGAQRPRRLRGGWLEAREAQRYTLARHWPPRFDVSASCRFPPVRADRLARQVRQDLWRLLQGLRGFSPVVEIQMSEEGFVLRAGGRVAGCVPAQTEARILSLLLDPRHRARWAAWARERAT